MKCRPLIVFAVLAGFWLVVVTSAAAGERLDPIPFSQIRTLTARGEAGLYQAEGVIYTPGGPGALDVHATPGTWQRQGEEVEETGRFKASIEKVRGAGGERWVLREYRVRPAGAD